MSTPTQSPAARAIRWSGGVLGALAIGGAALQAADQLAQRTTETEHSYRAADAVVLVADGDVTVTTGGTVVEVLARDRSGFTPSRYTADEADGRLEIRHECDGVSGSGCVASLDVRVPEGSHVTIRSSSGDTSALGVVGDVEVSTRVGDVRVDGVTGRVVAASGSGDVEVSQAGGSVDASSDIGRIAVHEASGAVGARSGSGDIDVRDAGGSVEASTDVGSVTVRQVRGDVVVDAGSGDLEVAGVLGDVRATTDIGRVVVRSTGDPVALDIATEVGRSTIDAPTDPASTRSVFIRSGSGDVLYLGAADAVD